MISLSSSLAHALVWSDYFFKMWVNTPTSELLVYFTCHFSVPGYKSAPTAEYGGRCPHTCRAWTPLTLDIPSAHFPLCSWPSREELGFTDPFDAKHSRASGGGSCKEQSLKTPGASGVWVHGDAALQVRRHGHTLIAHVLCTAHLFSYTWGFHTKVGGKSDFFLQAGEVRLW